MTEPAPLRLGTRGSLLARTQAGHVAADLERSTGRPVELVFIETRGDVDQAPLTSFGGAGVFVSAVRAALRDGRVDLVVHSLKDLPTEPEPDLVVAAIPPREDPRDALVARGGATLAELRARGAVAIGTGSPRRAVQVRALLPGARVEGLRGNVDTRIRAGREGELDGVVLALAGLRRIGRDDVAVPLDVADMVPAPGQGALAVECRADDAAVRAALAGLDDAETRAAVTAERIVLRATEAGCSAPLGALATIAGGIMTLRCVVGDDETIHRFEATGPVERAPQLAADVAERMVRAAVLSTAPAGAAPAETEQSP